MIGVGGAKMKIKTVKIFGERHTATNAVHQFLHRNFEVEIPYYAFMGWKHRLAPRRKEWSKYHCENVLFVFTTRSPYTWLRSMHREPYYFHQPKIVQLKFRYFIQHSMEDYENVIQIWNEKNASYQRMYREVPNALFVRQEDFLLHQGTIWEQLCSYLTPRSDQHQPFTKYTGGYGEARGEEPNSTISVPDVSDEAFEIINRQLDTGLMDFFGYDIIKSQSEEFSFNDQFLLRQYNTDEQ